MEKCKKCGQSKQIIKVFECGFDVCMCDWNFSKIFKDADILQKNRLFTNIKNIDFSAPTLIDQIGELKDLVLLGIGHTYTIDVMDDENRNEMTERLQKMYRTLMVMQTDEVLK